MPFSPLPSGYLSLTVFCSMLLWYWVLLRTDRSRSSRRIGPRGRMRACRRRRPPPARSLRPRQSRGGRRRPPCRRGRCRGCAESRRGRPPDRRPWLWEAAKKEGRTSLKLPALPSFAQYFWALLGTPMKILTPPRPPMSASIIKEERPMHIWGRTGPVLPLSLRLKCW